MIIVMHKAATQADIDRVTKLIRSKGLQEHVSRGEERIIIGAIGDERVFNPTEFERLPQVEKAIHIVTGWRIISREVQTHNTVITVRGVAFGNGNTLQAAYCSGDIPPQLSEHISAVLTDPFRLSDNPYANPEPEETHESSSLQRQCRDIRQQNKIVIVRIRDSRHIQAALDEQADILLLGGELLANRHILQEIGSLNIPAVICKDKHHTVRDWLLAAEQTVLRGNPHIILGEAGTLSSNSRRLRLDTDAIVQAKKLCHLPVLADISRLNHRYMDTDTLQRLAQAAGADIIVS